MARKKIPAAIQDKILTECRRRCALCFALNNDVSAKVQGQIAHIDRNPENGDASNLAYLCLEHASLYDTVSRQSKAFTPGELTVYKETLLLVLRVAHDPHRIHLVVAELYLKIIAELAEEARQEQKKNKIRPKRKG
jgi:hypothetical protein